MRVIIQRVTSAQVSVDGSLISKIGKGYLLLVGITRDDIKEGNFISYVVALNVVSHTYFFYKISLI